MTKHPLLTWERPPTGHALGSNRPSGRRWPAGVALFAVLALLIASTAQADSPRHMHDYLAVSGIAAVSPDVADHAAIRELVGDLANSNTIARHQHDYLASTSATASAATGSVVVASPLAASGSVPSNSFGWGDFGIGIGTGVGAMLILLGVGTAALMYRRRARKDLPAVAA